MVTHLPPSFEGCMLGCDESADLCLSDDALDENGIALCDETKVNCYRRCASREAVRRSKEAGYSLTCKIAMVGEPTDTKGQGPSVPVPCAVTGGCTREDTGEAVIEVITHNKDGTISVETWTDLVAPPSA